MNCEAIRIKYYESVFVLAFVIRHTKRIFKAALLFHAWLSGCTIFFFTFSYKLHDFPVPLGGLEHRICVLIFFTHFDRNISHTKNN